MQESLKGLGLVQLVQHPQLLIAVGLHVRNLDSLLDPLALIGILQVHVFDADGAGVGVAQHAKNLPKFHQGATAEASGGELPVQIPQRQPVAEHVEVGMGTLLVLQRIGVGHQVPSDPVGVDDLLHPDRLVQVRFVTGGDVVGPANRLVGDT